ncbi:MAG: phosphodiesterase [Lachnospiraceae bacterium]
MSRFMIASDIHGSAYYCQQLQKRWKEEKVEKLFLLGDLLYHGPRNDLPQDYEPKKVIAMLNEMSQSIVCVRGNCEAEVDQMVLNFPVMAESARIYADGLEMFLTHGHLYHEDKLPNLSEGEIFIQGHTHIPVMEKREHYVMLNPGSVSIPKNGSEHTYIIYENRYFYLKDMQGKILQTLDLKHKEEGKLEHYDFQELRGIVHRLHSPEGCPWDRVQTHKSLCGDTIEEAYEIVQAIDSLERTGNFENLKEELGDILFLVLLHSEIASSEGNFSIDDVIETAAKKMIHRHPHIFGGDTTKTWEELKQEEHPQVSLAELMKEEFPALLRAQKYIKKSGSHRSEDSLRSEMLTILTDDGDLNERQIGKLIFDMVELAQKNHTNAEMALYHVVEQMIETKPVE